MGPASQCGSEFHDTDAASRDYPDAKRLRIRRGIFRGLGQKLLEAAVGADFDHERGGNKRKYYV
jgi:hypothetical protein